METTNTMPDDDDDVRSVKIEVMDCETVVAKNGSKDGWIARLTGIGGKYGMSRDFLPPVSSERHNKRTDYVSYHVTIQGVYDVMDSEDGRSFRVYRVRDGRHGYITVTQERATEIVRLTQHCGMGIIAALAATKV